MVRSVADDEKLLRPQPHPAAEFLVDGHRLDDRQLVIASPLAAGQGVAVGVSLDADDLVGIVAAEFAGHLGDEARGPGANCAPPGSNNWLAGNSMRIVSPSRRTWTPGCERAGSVCKKLLLGVMDTPVCRCSEALRACDFCSLLRCSVCESANCVVSVRS